MTFLVDVVVDTVVDREEDAVTVVDMVVAVDMEIMAVIMVVVTFMDIVAVDGDLVEALLLAL